MFEFLQFHLEFGWLMNTVTNLLNKIPKFTKQSNKFAVLHFMISPLASTLIVNAITSRVGIIVHVWHFANFLAIGIITFITSYAYKIKLSHKCYWKWNRIKFKLIRRNQLILPLQKRDSTATNAITNRANTINFIFSDRNFKFVQPYVQSIQVTIWMFSIFYFQTAAVRPFIPKIVLRKRNSFRITSFKISIKQF